MISGVLFILVGEVLLFRLKIILAYTVIFITGNLIYIPLFEEAGLTKRFGDEYIMYKRNVPTWIPRMKPWKPEERYSNKK